MSTCVRCGELADSSVRSGTTRYGYCEAPQPTTTRATWAAAARRASRKRRAYRAPKAVTAAAAVARCSGSDQARAVSPWNTSGASRAESAAVPAARMKTATPAAMARRRKSSRSSPAASTAR